MPTEQRKLGDDLFDGTLEAADIGDFLITRLTFGAQVTEATPLTIRRHNKQDTLAVTLKLAGEARVKQYDNAAIQRAGDLLVMDSNRPVIIENPGSNGTLLIELPRDRLERMLGSARLFAALTVSGDLPGASLARTFFDELIRVHDKLSPEMARRMSSVGVDLLVASIAERLAQEPPKSLQGTVLVQRAKAYVEEHLGDPTLDPPGLAAALGISLRRLQALFHERGWHVSDWIWKRRLEVAAKQLADPGLAHLSIGSVCYACGFLNQSHFSRRFRDGFDISPTDYRRAALMRVAQQDGRP